MPPENDAAEKDAISKVVTAWSEQHFLGNGAEIEVIDVDCRLRHRSPQKMIWSSLHKDWTEKVIGAQTSPLSEASKGQVSEYSLPC
jgi:hypothetical protein